VRARPLGETAPELAQVVKSRAEGPTRSIAAVRGATDARTLSWHELLSVVRRFRSDVRGTVAYHGALLRLLDVPSWPGIERKLYAALQRCGGVLGDALQSLDRFQDGRVGVGDAREALRRVGTHSHTHVSVCYDMYVFTHLRTRARPVRYEQELGFIA
jgi:hypothetical protein